MNISLRQAVNDRILLADGALGTELQWLGLEPGGCCELWNIEHPDKVRAIHRAYLHAGAQLLITNSFRGNRLALSVYDLERRVKELNQAAAEIACEVAGDHAWVLGSIGPFGGFLEPVGETRAKDVFDAFVEQAEALLDGGVDALIIETVSATREIELAVQAAREAGGQLIFTTMTFAKVNNDYRTMMGTSPEEAAEAMLNAGADVIGCNCGTDLTMEDYVQIIDRFRACSTKPIIAKPNAGQPELAGTSVVYKHTPERMAEKVTGLLEAGASIIGGCCGTTPEHIRLFREKLLVAL